MNSALKRFYFCCCVMKTNSKLRQNIRKHILIKMNRTTPVQYSLLPQHTSTCIHTHTRTHTSTHTHAPAHPHTHAQTCTHVHLHIHTHMYTHTRPHTYRHMHTHTCTHTCTHTYMSSICNRQFCPRSASSLCYPALRPLQPSCLKCLMIKEFLDGGGTLHADTIWKKYWENLIRCSYHN